MLFGIGRGVPCCQATLKSGIRNRKETENQNRESTNQRKQVLQIQCTLKITARTVASKNKRKKCSNKNSLSVEICATLISSEGYDYENLKACLHGGRVPWLTGIPG